MEEDARGGRLPGWLRRPGQGGASHEVKRLLRGLRLGTVCEGARCPNLGECFGRGTAAFMILGDVCTRRCGFCAVPKGIPAPPDPGETERLAEAAAALGLGHVVVTSVTRDDLPDGGAAQFAAVVRALRARLPGVPVEVLVPDFGGDRASLGLVLAERPDVLNHNLETVPRLYPEVRPGADFRRSLALLEEAAASGVEAKSGMMLGLGETDAEVEEVMADLRRAGCRSLSLGQYLRPTRASLPVSRFVTPDRFDFFGRLGYKIGFRHVASGPLVRSSYRAEEGLGRGQASDSSACESRN